MVFNTIINLITIVFISILILISLFILITLILEVLERIRNMIYWKKYKGIYVIAKFEKDVEGIKNKIIYISKIGENYYWCTQSISEALKFNNQKEALDAIKKCSFESMFVIKL